MRKNIERLMTGEGIRFAIVAEVETGNSVQLRSRTSIPDDGLVIVLFGDADRVRAANSHIEGKQPLHMWG